ncbi:MAG: hypothetical protein WCB74_10900, partial [Pseudolabrys sp.]
RYKGPIASLLEQSDTPQRQRRFRQKVAPYAANFQPLCGVALINSDSGTGAKKFKHNQRFRNIT